MNLVPTAIGNAVARRSLVLNAQAPGLLFGAGIVGVVGSTVLACRATLKMEEIMSDANAKIQTAKNLEHRNYSERDRQKDLAIIRSQAVIHIVRAYAPAIIVGTLGIAALTKSHRILTHRNAALMAAYSALEKGFNEYRARVIEKYGSDEDRNLRYGTRTVTVGEGKERHEVTRVAMNDPSIYARFFDEYSPNWSPHPETNLIFLKCQQNSLNDLLLARGHVFLNEVYDALGLPRSQAGQVVGWVKEAGDSYIDFGIFTDRSNSKIREFVNGYESSILLDFNVSGVIYDKIGLEK
jgi:hypothetical protein